MTRTSKQHTKIVPTCTKNTYMEGPGSYTIKKRSQSKALRGRGNFSEYNTIQNNFYSLRLQTCNNKRSDANMQNVWRQDGSICLHVTQRINKKENKKKTYSHTRGQQLLNFRITNVNLTCTGLSLSLSL